MIRIDKKQLVDRSFSTHREWLETDGCGGYAATSISFALTRRYHGLLCVPIEELGERHVLISKLMPTLLLDGGERFELDCNLFADGSVIAPTGDTFLESFWIDTHPHWEFRCGPAKLEISILMPRGIPVTLVEYRLRGVERANLLLQPLIAARNIHSTAHVNMALKQHPVWNANENKLRFKPYVGCPGFSLQAPVGTHWKVKWKSEPTWWRDFYLARDRERGFDASEDLHVPGTLSLELQSETSAIVACCSPAYDNTAIARNSSESLITLFNDEVERRQNVYGNGDIIPTIRRAAEQFLTVDSQGHAGIVAGYPWFERWGRDTLIALHPLTAIIGDFKTERAILEQQISLVENGLVPNLITADGTKLYNSVDAVLWLFIAIHRHVERTQDLAWARENALPTLRVIVETLQSGTIFDIFSGSDGLISAGSGDVQLTWMDAKINGHPVTPRHGKTVEINALWFNALKILANLETTSSAQLKADSLAAITQRSFVSAFIAPDGSLRDIVGSQSSTYECRPNQIFALSLPYALLTAEQCEPILNCVRAKLLTPRGLRTLSPDDQAYCARYEGEPEKRDRAYHQGTAWPWLFAPYIEALMKRGESHELSQLRKAFAQMLSEGCVGSIAEVYDAEPPQYPEGCFAQAWSIASAATLFLRSDNQ